MKAILIYSAALLALCVLIFSKDQTQPVPTGKFDARVTVLGLSTKFEAGNIMEGMMQSVRGLGVDPIGQIAPEGMLS